jgi:signal transduction histidine kinase
VKDVLDLFHPMARHLGVQLEFVPPEEQVLIHGHPEALRELLSNLVINACQAAVEAPRIPPRVVIRLTCPRDGWGRIAVRDTGPGPPAALQPRLFEPFVTDKPDGMGLGLFVAGEIAQAHGGNLMWERDDGMTCFYFEFPLGDAYG